jgi:cytochrome b561
MIPIRNTSEGYGIIAILIHWSMAVIVLGMIALGWYMTDLTISLQKLKLFGLHKEWGVLVLFLVTLRLGWRMMNNIPPLPQHIPYLQRAAAHGMHYALYTLLFIIPISGWLMTSAAGLSISFFGLFMLPDLITPHREWLHILETVHGWLAYTLLALIILHATAALKHHFIDKDTILRRIISW